MKYTDKHGRPFDLSRFELLRIDEEQERTRYPAWVVNRIIAIVGATALLKDNSPALERCAKESGAWKQLKTAQGLLTSGLQKIVEHISAAQTLTVLNQSKNLMVSVGAHPQPSKINLEYWQVELLVAAALQHCQGCLCGTKEARECELRKVLDTIPCAVGNDWMVCPYQDGSLENIDITDGGMNP